MNILNELCMVTLEQNGGAWAIIPAQEMAQLQQAQYIINTARQRAAACLQRARMQRSEERKRFRRRLAQQKKALKRQYSQHFDRAKEEGTHAALHWLVDQHQWEHGVYQKLTAEIVTLLSLRLKKISEKLPWEQLLFEQIAPVCHELQNQNALTLKVAPSLFDSLPADVLDLPVTIEKNENLLYGEAILESSLVRVKFNLASQIEQLGNLLATLRWEQLNEPD